MKKTSEHFDNLTGTIKSAAASDPQGSYERCGYTGQLKKQGSNLVGLCCFHEETTPSFSIKVTGQHAGTWSCFGCQAGGSIIDFVMQSERLEFADALSRAAEHLGIDTEKKPQKKPAGLSNTVVDALHRALTKKGKALGRFVKARGLSNDIIEQAHLGFDGDRYTIPVYDQQGKLVDIRKYSLDGEPKFLAWEKGAGSTRLFGWQYVKDEELLVLAEGELDALTLIDQGIPAFSVTNGAGKWPDDPPDLTGKTVYVDGDADAAGQKMNVDLPPKLYAAGAAQVFVVQWPPDVAAGYDVTDYFLDGGTADGFRKLMDKAGAVAPPKPSRDLETGRELMADPEPDGIWLVQDMFERGHLVILAGRGKVGKSFMALQLAQAIASGSTFLGRQCQQADVIYAALEDGRRRVGKRLRLQGADPDVVEHIRFRYAKDWTPINADDGPDQLRALIDQANPGILIIDTLTTAKTGKLDENVAGDVADLMNGVHLLAEETGVTILFLYHHHKMATGDVVLDMRGSTAFGASADTILGLYRDKRKRETGLVGAGRDIDNLDLAISWNKSRLLWELIGDADKMASTEAERNALAALEYIDRPATATEIGKELSISRQSAIPALESLVEKQIAWRDQKRIGKNRPTIIYGLGSKPADDPSLWAENIPEGGLQ